MKEIYTSNHIWKLFEDFTVDMARVTNGISTLSNTQIQSVFEVFLLCVQVCNKREKRLSDPILERYIINVVFDTINAFFSSPFSENSTSLQVRTSANSVHQPHICHSVSVISIDKDDIRNNDDIRTAE